MPTHRIKFNSNYAPHLFVGCTPASELVTVQRPWAHILQQLPAPVYVHKFGGK